VSFVVLASPTIKGIAEFPMKLRVGKVYDFFLDQFQTLFYLKISKKRIDVRYQYRLCNQIMDCAQSLQKLVPQARELPVGVT
jgi:hypothetical protein